MSPPESLIENELQSQHYKNFRASSPHPALSVPVVQFSRFGVRCFLNELLNLYFQVFPRENVVSALLAVYKHNVLQFQEGTMGAVNGMRPNGQVFSILFPCCFYTVAVYAIRYVGLLLKRVILRKPWRRLSGLFLVFTRNEPNTRFFRWHEESPHTIKHMISLKPLATATLLSSIPHEQPC